MNNLDQWMDGDKSEGHLAHAACRMLMLVATVNKENHP